MSTDRCKYQLFATGPRSAPATTSTTLTDSRGDGHFPYTAVATDRLGNASDAHLRTVDIDNDGAAG